MEDNMQLHESAEKVLQSRGYREGETSWDQVVDRILKELKYNTDDIDINDVNGEALTIYDKFMGRLTKQLLLDRILLPNSPCIYNAGSSKPALFACFVVPVRDSIDSIFQTVARVATIHKNGGGVGIDFSNLRPEGMLVHTTGKQSSGPVSFMKVFDAATDSVRQGGIRRGANMGTLFVRHPDILKFIRVKREDHSILTNFNISVTVDDVFIICVKNYPNEPFLVWHPSYDEPDYDPKSFEVDSVRYLKEDGFVTDNKNEAVTNQYIWDEICLSAWSVGCPGLINLDRVNQIETHYETTGYMPLGDYFKYLRRDKDTLYEDDTYESFSLDTLQNMDPNVVSDKNYQLCTNPCGEIPLTANESCVLASINVAAIDTFHKFMSKAPKDSDTVFTALLNNLFSQKGKPWSNKDIQTVKSKICDLFPLRDIILHTYEMDIQSIFDEKVFGMENSVRSQVFFGLVVTAGMEMLNRMLNNNYFHDPYIEQVTKELRRVGLGLMGVADWAIQNELRYGSDSMLEAYEDLILQPFATMAQQSTFTNSGVYGGTIYKSNTTIAPTGTLSILAECSSGIEPNFSFQTYKRVLDQELYDVHPLFKKQADKHKWWNKTKDEVLADLSKHHGSPGDINGIDPATKKIFVTAHDVTPDEHLSVQKLTQNYITNAISKTINLPNDATVDDVSHIYLSALEINQKHPCKGITIYRDGCREYQVLNTSSTLDKSNESVTKSSTPEPVRWDGPSELLQGYRLRRQTRECSVYAHVYKDPRGFHEIFLNAGKAGNLVNALAQALGRIISYATRNGGDLREIGNSLIGISTSNYAYPISQPPHKQNYGLVDAVGRMMIELADISDHMEADNNQNLEDVSENSAKQVFDSSNSDGNTFTECPVCGMELYRLGHCTKCSNPSCQYEECS